MLRPPPMTRLAVSEAPHIQTEEDEKIFNSETIRYLLNHDTELNLGVTGGERKLRVKQHCKSRL